MYKTTLEALALLDDNTIDADLVAEMTGVSPSQAYANICKLQEDGIIHIKDHKVIFLDQTNRSNKCL